MCTRSAVGDQSCNYSDSSRRLPQPADWAGAGLGVDGARLTAPVTPLMPTPAAR